MRCTLVRKQYHLSGGVDASWPSLHIPRPFRSRQHPDTSISREAPYSYCDLLQNDCQKGSSNGNEWCGREAEYLVEAGEAEEEQQQQEHPIPSFRCQIPYLYLYVDWRVIMGVHPLVRSLKMT